MFFSVLYVFSVTNDLASVGLEIPAHHSYVIISDVPTCYFVFWSARLRFLCCFFVFLKLIPDKKNDTALTEMPNGKAVFLNARKEKAKRNQNRTFRLFLCKHLAVIVY